MTLILIFIDGMFILNKFQIINLSLLYVCLCL